MTIPHVHMDVHFRPRCFDTPDVPRFFQPDRLAEQCRQPAYSRFHFPIISLFYDFGSSAITLRGRLEILTDAKTKQENWYSGLESHFSGADDPNYCVLQFTTERYKLFIDWEETEGGL
jgi:hypothetical protein